MEAKEKKWKGIRAARLIVGINLAFMFFTYYAQIPEAILGMDQRIVSVGSAPSSVAVNPNTNMIYVANEHDNTLSIINQTSTQTKQCFAPVCVPEIAFPNDSK